MCTQQYYYETFLNINYAEFVQLCQICIRSCVLHLLLLDYRTLQFSLATFMHITQNYRFSRKTKTMHMFFLVHIMAYICFIYYYFFYLAKLEFKQVRRIAPQFRLHANIVCKELPLKTANLHRKKRNETPNALKHLHLYMQTHRTKYSS